MHFTFKLLITLICGVALSFAQAPYDLWLLIFPCFGTFYYLYQSLETKKQAFILSFLFALGYFIAGLYWIGNALLVDGNPYKWAWPLAVVALPMLLSIFPALYLTINHALSKSNGLARFIGFCLFLTFSEWVRGHAFTGFPWNLYGYAAASIPALGQSLSFIGPYGLSFLTVFWSASLGYLAINQHHRITIAILALATIGSTYFYGDQRLKKAELNFHEDYLIHIVQPNIEQSEKWKNEKLVHNFEEHMSAIVEPFAADKRHVVIWPETAIPPILLNSPAVNERIQNMLGDNAILLTGALTMRNNPDSNALEYSNALLTWSNKKPATQIYSKSHLVPFGEYVPFQKYIPIPTVTQFSGFTQGQGTQTIQLNDFPSFSPLICYEVIFPHEAVNKDQKRPDYILTITNDGWYGDSAGPHQHFAQARFRAIEQGIPVIRSANTGISGVINPYGTITSHLPLLKKGNIATKLSHKLEKPTFYSLYGDIPYLIFSALLLLAFIIGVLSFKTKKT